MNYSTGCAFSLDDIIMNLHLKELLFTCDDCYKITKSRHRDVLVKRIFLFNLKQIINDIINNNVTFHLPLTGSKRCNIHMRRVEGEDFKNLRRGGKWRDVDIVKSWFNGYQLSIYLLGNRTPRVKSIYLNTALRDRITENTNKGMAYGDSKYDTYIKDYINGVCEHFSSISEQDIKRILNFCWKSVYLHNSYGGDTLFTDKEIWCYIGNLKKNSLDHFFYYIRKLTIKLRVLYKRKKIKWDGYYYFALTDVAYRNYLSQINKRGRPRKTYSFGNVFMYQILDECKIYEYDKKYIFKVPIMTFIKTKYYARDFKSQKAELILTREPLNFKDLTICGNDYEFL